jgi:cobalt-zinc-cadmium efflux system membrane fusion protein
MRAKSRLLVAAICAISLGSGCDREQGETSTATESVDAGHADEGRVRFSPEQVREFGIRVATAEAGRVDGFVELPAEVHANGDRLAHIVPRFAGIVREVRKGIGDAVRPGDTLAVIESSESLAPYELSSKTAGTVIEKHLTPGEAVDRDTQTFVVADLATVWVDVAVYQKDLDRVRVGQTARISAGERGPTADGPISYVTPIVDPATRTLTARVVLPNGDGQWRPGMFVTARVLEPIEADVSIERSAVQILAGNSVVFVEDGESFVRRPVMLGRSGETTVEITSGLSAGQRYVAANSFLVKAELAKSEAEHED